MFEMRMNQISTHLISQTAFSKWRSSGTVLDSFKNATLGDTPSKELSLISVNSAKFPTEGHKSISTK